ncbi:hypothetical protein HO133_008248 [Letharia lupina]|uniref:Uncharacterized protein n=1 Tax=Letharia lupina TaxID=560253 RepID=A0A8H6CRZ6_9LECA|nr:uncharacterized protein HO133_008248 [Letharia lupina]KAF6228518.1 hypothetical protein HO133_008248 [Letharia lupina]
MTKNVEVGTFTKTAIVFDRVKLLDVDILLKDIGLLSTPFELRFYSDYLGEGMREAHEKGCRARKEAESVPSLIVEFAETIETLVVKSRDLWGFKVVLRVEFIDSDGDPELMELGRRASIGQ